MERLNLPRYESLVYVFVIVVQFVPEQARSGEDKCLLTSVQEVH
jgi:hypothetical protein